MHVVRSRFLLGVLTLLAPLGATAQAQDPSGLGYGYLYGYGAINTPAISSFVPAPPYFALHPPVYYGKRYTRPYGDSPFASWPQLQAAQGYRPRPAAAHAPQVHLQAPVCPLQGAYSSPVVQQVRSAEPLVIENPYYKADEVGRLVTSSDNNESGHAAAE
jgi:hypothetical protein